MANKRISELPNLDPDNLIPSAAFIIVEQYGVTHKMPVLGFGGASAAAELVRDSKSTSLYAPEQNTVTLTFPETGINNRASAWSLDFVAKNTENGHKAHLGSLVDGKWGVHNLSEVGDKKDLRITKNTGLNLINVEGTSYSTSSNTKVKIGSFNSLSEEYERWDTGTVLVSKYVDYYVTINCSNSDKIVLVFSSDRRLVKGGSSANSNRLGGWEFYPGVRADLTAIIEGSISA